MLRNLSQNKTCRICRNKDLKKFLDLGKSTLANSFIREKDLKKPEESYPLRVYFCPNCYLVQLRDVVKKEVLFRDYIYFSSSMPKLSDHFKKYAEDIVKRFLKNKKDFVLEIGSNDGILLKFFKDANFPVLGVDPALNIKKSVSTIEDFFSEDLAYEILKNHGPAKVIMGNNVVAHINNHHDLVRGLNVLLADDGVFVFEVPYLVDMFENLTYDTIYHEHLSYLSLSPLIKLFGQYGLYVFDVKLFPVQGQSLRVFVSRPGGYSTSTRIRGFLDKEKSLRLDKLKTYLSLAKKIEKSKEKLVKKLKELKSRGKTIAAYGAPAKGNTILNYCKIDISLVDYALDALKSKQGLYTPGMHLPVVSPEEARKKLPDYFLLLAWNYADHILAKEREFITRGGRFILPINDIKIL